MMDLLYPSSKSSLRLLFKIVHECSELFVILEIIDIEACNDLQNCMY